MLRLPAVLAAVLLAAPPLAAQAADPAPAASPEAVTARALFDALRLPEIVAIIADEGGADADALARDIFGDGPAPAGWSDAVAAVYDAERLESALLADFEAALDGRDLAPMLAFFGAEPGRSIVAREVETRAALSDSDAEAAAREEAAVAMAADSPRLEPLRRYIDALDLVELNVTGTLNSNLAYLAALLDGGAMRPDMTEGDLLSDVASQEPAIRAETTEWVWSFLLRAYDGLPEADLEALIAFSRTPAGQELNAAVFAAFDASFARLSRNLGTAAARYMATQEL